jgi:hypothetical protein
MKSCHEKLTSFNFEGELVKPLLLVFGLAKKNM